MSQLFVKKNVKQHDSSLGLLLQIQVQYLYLQTIRANGKPLQTTLIIQKTSTPAILLPTITDPVCVPTYREHLVISTINMSMDQVRNG